jgi:hypothetical protein
MTGGLCECGCGRSAALATRTRRGNVAGQPLRYARGHENRGRFSALDPALSVFMQGDGCWPWMGCVDTTTGYGRFCFEGHTWLAHRFFYVRAFGPIPKGHVVHHTCGNRICCNPAHFMPLTRRAHVAVHRSKEN